MSNNGSAPTTEKLWGKIKEVLVKDIPPQSFPLRVSKWQPLATDILLRLEETSAQFALEVPLADEDMAQRCAAGVRKLFVRVKGEGAVEIIRRGSTLYFRRGGNW